MAWPPRSRPFYPPELPPHPTAPTPALPSAACPAPAPQHPASRTWASAETRQRNWTPRSAPRGASWLEEPRWIRRVYLSAPFWSASGLERSCLWTLLLPRPREAGKARDSQEMQLAPGPVLGVGGALRTPGSLRESWPRDRACPSLLTHHPRPWVPPVWAYLGVWMCTHVLYTGCSTPLVTQGLSRP